MTPPVFPYQPPTQDLFAWTERQQKGAVLGPSDRVAGRGSGGGALPCLSSNNCTEGGEKQPDKKESLLCGNHKRTAIALSENIQYLAEQHGVEKLGFLTLTFADKVTSLVEAQKRYRSLRTHVLQPRYGEVIRVIERQKSGRIHYHLVIVLPEDIRTGFDFSAIAQGNYKSAGHALRAEWAFWRRTAPKYRFGRTELLPVKSTAQGIARYVGKYISKHIENRPEEDKGARLVEYTKGARSWSTRFGFNTIGARLWREKCAILAKAVKLEEAEFSKRLGSRWAFKSKDIIRRIRLPEYWSDDARVVDTQQWTPADFAEMIRILESGHSFFLTGHEAALEIAFRTYDKTSTRRTNDENE